MQTEHVTFLTRPESKAALDALAARKGKSVGNVLREASSRYIAEGERSDDASDEAEALEMILPNLEKMLPRWAARPASIERPVDEARAFIRESLARVEATK